MKYTSTWCKDGEEFVRPREHACVLFSNGGGHACRVCHQKVSLYIPARVRCVHQLSLSLPFTNFPNRSCGWHGGMLICIYHVRAPSETSLEFSHNAHSRHILSRLLRFQLNIPSNHYHVGHFHAYVSFIPYFLRYVVTGTLSSDFCMISVMISSAINIA